MAKFNYRDYDEYYVMHCNTKEEAEIFGKYLDSEGLRWHGGERYPGNMRFDTGPCYRFTKGVHDSLQAYLDAPEWLYQSVTILDFTEFDWGTGESSNIVIPFEVILQGTTINEV